MTPPESLSVELFALTLKPGDLLIAKVPDGTPADVMRQFKVYLAGVVPAGVRPVVVHASVEFVVPGR